MKTDFESKRKEQIELFGKGKKLLLHACCAPCSTACIERLIEDFDITVYFYNPNMDSKEEYEKRAEEIKRFLSVAYKDKVGLITEDYLPSEYLNAVNGLENQPEGGARCEKCFYLRLEKTAEYAQKNSFDFITATLTVSPYKNAPLINQVGESVCENSAVKWLYSDFKKANGYLRSIELSKLFGLYRQNYCGCVFSKNEREKQMEDRCSKT